MPQHVIDPDLQQQPQCRRRGRGESPGRRRTCGRVAARHRRHGRLSRLRRQGPARARRLGRGALQLPCQHGRHIAHWPARRGDRATSTTPTASTSRAVLPDPDIAAADRRRRPDREHLLGLDPHHLSRPHRFWFDEGLSRGDDPQYDQGTRSTPHYRQYCRPGRHSDRLLGAASCATTRKCTGTSPSRPHSAGPAFPTILV
jgi:hypothetical protein